MDFPLLIFTDLDGSLLDHHSYSFKDAKGALKQLRRLAIPLILTSSKTRTELRKLQKKLGLNEPFIAENGGGVFIPADYVLLETHTLKKTDKYRCRQFGRPYSYVRAVFEKVRLPYNIRGFGDMSVEEIMTVTGLTKKHALAARERDYTEPFRFLAKPRLLELQQEVAEYGLTITRGGRFYHLMAADQNKGRAVAETTRLFQAQSDNKIITVGLGDAENDCAMLKEVDIPVLIPKPDYSYEHMDLPGLRRAPYPGSRGWGAAVTEILHELQAGSIKVSA